MMKTMIICFLIYVTHTLCASNGYGGVGLTHNESEATYGNITDELNFYKSRELKIERSIAKRVYKEVRELLLEREKLGKSLQQHERIMNCHSTEANRFDFLKATIKYNYANVIVDAMSPFFVLNDQILRMKNFHTDVKGSIEEIRNKLDQTTMQETEPNMNLNYIEFMTVLNGYSDMIDKGNFNWDEFMKTHYLNVGRILNQDFTRMTPVQTQLYYQTALLLRLLVVEKLFASHIKQLNETLSKNVLEEKYGWLQLPLDKTEKITDYVISYNGSEYTDALQKLYDFVCQILYLDERDRDSIELANIVEMYSYYSSQYISESYFKGFCRIFSSDNVINLLEERRKSYDEFYELIGESYAVEIKRETKKHKEKSEMEFDKYKMKIRRLRSDLAKVKENSNELEKEIFYLESLVAQKSEKLKELENKLGCTKQRYPSKDDNRTQQLGERQSLRKVQV